MHKSNESKRLSDISITRLHKQQPCFHSAVATRSRPTKKGKKTIENIIGKRKSSKRKKEKKDRERKADGLISCVNGKCYRSTHLKSFAC